MFSLSHEQNKARFNYAWRENKGVANLDGIYTDGLGLPVGKKSLGEIFFKMLLRKKYFREIES